MSSHWAKDPLAKIGIGQTTSTAWPLIGVPHGSGRWQAYPVIGDSHAASTSTGQECSQMAFGQQSGPPASAKQIRELSDLLKGAGHSDFRDARGPMGFTQRQAAGKFSRDEAAAFITQLLDAESDGGIAIAAPTWRQSAQEQMLGTLPSEQLASELRRRGWTAIEP